MSWTPERVEKLKKLTADGLSGSQIASQLGGVTRNAVIGKIHRLGLTGRAKTKGPSSRVVKPRTPSPRRPRNNFGSGFNKSPKRFKGKPTKAMAVPAHKDELHVPLVELDDSQCHWPTKGEGREQKYCGLTAEPRTNMCKYHREHKSR
jgi:GcrA cell cycle regulator